MRVGLIIIIIYIFNRNSNGTKSPNILNIKTLAICATGMDFALYGVKYRYLGLKHLGEVSREKTQCCFARFYQPSA